METLSRHWWHCTHIAETKASLWRGRMHKIVWQAPLLRSFSSSEVFVEASCYRRVIRRQLHDLWENISLEITLKLDKSNHYSFKIFPRLWLAYISQLWYSNFFVISQPWKNLANACRYQGNWRQLYWHLRKRDWRFSASAVSIWVHIIAKPNPRIATCIQKQNLLCF